MFTKVMRARKITIDATIHVAHLRGYTACRSRNRRMPSQACSTHSTTICANAIWAYDGLFTKTIGDAVMAVFNFPLVRAEHPGNAVPARDIQKGWRERASSRCSPWSHASS